MIRIIAGRHRSRPLELPANASVRPTADRVREALFSMLGHRLGSWQDVRVLDACCGTGAGGLEAISRGAAAAVFMDRAPAALELARRNAARLGESGVCTFLLTDVVSPPPAASPCHLLLLDPPYAQDLAGPALEALTMKGWAAPGALAAVEVGREESFISPAGWSSRNERSHGPARLIILELADNK